jgi:hypothetical protein
VALDRDLPIVAGKKTVEGLVYQEDLKVVSRSSAASTQVKICPLFWLTVTQGSDDDP